MCLRGVHGGDNTYWCYQDISTTAKPADTSLRVPSQQRRAALVIRVQSHACRHLCRHASARVCELCADICVDICGSTSVYRHVCRHACRHMCRYACHTVRAGVPGHAVLGLHGRLLPRWSRMFPLLGPMPCGLSAGLSSVRVYSRCAVTVQSLCSHCTVTVQSLYSPCTVLAQSLPSQYR